MRKDSTGALIPAEDRELTASWDAPRPSLPSLPRSSGAWFGTRNRILRKDTEYVEQSTRNLNALASQTDAMRSLMVSRVALARAMTEIAAIGEICAGHFLKGRRQRANELLVHDLKCQTEEAVARTQLTGARQKLAELNPEAARPDHPPRGGLTPAEVDELVRDIPEISPDARRTLSLLINGRLSEKQKK